MYKALQGMKLMGLTVQCCKCWKPQSWSSTVMSVHWIIIVMSCCRLVMSWCTPILCHSDIGLVFFFLMQYLLRAAASVWKDNFGGHQSGKVISYYDASIPGGKKKVAEYSLGCLPPLSSAWKHLNWAHLINKGFWSSGCLMTNCKWPTDLWSPDEWAG